MNMMDTHQIATLRKICSSEDGANSHLVQKAMDETLDVSEIEKLCDLISGELLMEGIGPDFEPNDYGRELEALLDVINRKRLNR